MHDDSKKVLIVGGRRQGSVAIRAMAMALAGKGFEAQEVALEHNDNVYGSGRA